MGHYFTNEEIDSNIHFFDFSILGHDFKFMSDNGVFSKNGLDFGSRLLLESIPLDEVGGKILDMGCGYGTIGIVLSKVINCYVDMVDISNRAIHLALENIKINHVKDINVFYSDIYQNVHSKYSSIITNPPIRAGNRVLFEMLINASNYLEDNGNLFFVMRKQHGALSIVKRLEEVFDVYKINQKKGFYVFKCIKNKR